MFTLIRRELEDHLVYLLAAVVFSAIMAGGLVFFAGMDFAVGGVLFGMVLLIIVFIGCASMGAAQMYADRAGKTSAFLATLQVTRGQILTARLVVGVFAIVAALLPVCITAAVLLCISLPPFRFYSHTFLEISATVFLIALACYCLGLQAGWSMSKILMLLASLVFPPFIVTLVLVKAFGGQAMAVLLVLIVACILRVATKFFSTAL